MLKSKLVSLEAKALYVILAAFADGKTGETRVRPKTLELVMGRSHSVRKRAQSELVEVGLLKIRRQRDSKGRLGLATFVVQRPESGRWSSVHFTTGGGMDALLRQVPSQESVTRKRESSVPKLLT